MSDLNQQLADISTKIAALKNNQVSRVAFTENAYNDDIADGVENYDYESEQNIPLASKTELNPTVVSKGFRGNSASLPRPFLNHFFGRVSYNLNKVVDFFKVVVDAVKTLNKLAGRYSPTEEYIINDVCSQLVTVGTRTQVMYFIRKTSTPEKLVGVPPITDGVQSTHWENAFLYFSIAPGVKNTAAGDGSLEQNTTGYSNTAFGFDALVNNTGGNCNTAVGVNALYSNTIGVYNTAVGFDSLYSNTTGSYNTAVGFNALYLNTTGHENTAIGNNALYSSTGGVNNTAVGETALYSNKTGHDNTAVGTGALTINTTGYNNTGLGVGAEAASPSSSNSITLGNTSITSLRCAVTTITAISDRRDKKNIETLGIGLEFIRALNPCGWNYDIRSDYGDDKRDGSKMHKNRNYGFIAQDLQEVQERFGLDLGLVMDDNPDRLETSEGKLLPVMINAIKELADRLDKIEGVKA